MRALRPTPLAVKLLIAIFIVLLVSLVPLRELLFPSPATPIAQPPALPTSQPLPTETYTPVSTEPLPAPVELTPLPRLPDPVWLANRTDGIILRIDPLTHEIKTQALEGRLGALTAGTEGVWVVQTVAAGESHLSRLDPDTLSLMTSIPLPEGNVTALQAGAGAVWVSLSPAEAESQPDAGTILRIDPLSNTITAAMPRRSAALDLAVHQHTLWLLEWLEPFTAFGRLDAANLQSSTLPASYDSAAAVYQFRQFSLGRAGIWAISQDNRSRYLYRVDPSSGAIASMIAAGPGPDDNPVAIAVGDEDLWVWLRSGKLVQIDPVREQVSGQVQLKPGLGRIHLRSDAVWVENESEAEVYRVNPLTLQVTAVLSSGSRPQPTPTPTPKPRPGTVQDCVALYPSRLKTGIQAYVNEEPPVPNRVRSEPNLTAEMVGRIEPGEVVTLLEGPVCTDGWVWWYIQSDVSDLTGWTSEDNEHEYWLVPVE